MPPQAFSKREILLAVLSGVILFTATFLYFIVKNYLNGREGLPVENTAVPSEQDQAVADSSAQDQSGVGLPVRLKIPVIHVDSVVVPVGLAPDGAMDAPKNPAEVAWFNRGVFPGENGTAVIAGHYDWKNNIPAVFDDLDKLGIGDKIFIENDKGVNDVFIVREIRIYRNNEAAPDVFGSSDGKAHLNLITCAGVWKKAENTYSERLVVFTDKE